MANWSDTDITLSGKRAREAYEYIESLCEDGVINLSKQREEAGKELGYSYLDEVELNSAFSDEETEENEFTITGRGRWAGPYSFVKDVVKKFNLGGTYVDKEMGCDFFHKISFKDGEVTEEIEGNYFCKESVAYNNDLDEWINHYQGCFSSDKLEAKIKEFKLFFPNDIDDEKEKEIRDRLSED